MPGPTHASPRVPRTTAVSTPGPWPESGQVASLCLASRCRPMVGPSAMNCTRRPSPWGRIQPHGKQARCGATGWPTRGSWGGGQWAQPEAETVVSQLLASSTLPLQGNQMSITFLERCTSAW